MALPDILAGPIVRRVTENEINVWICTSKKYDLGIAIYNTTLKKEKPYQKEETIGIGKALRCLKLSNKLYIYLLQAVPLKKGKDVIPFPPGKLLAYDICKLISPDPIKLGASVLTNILAVISLTNEMVLPTIVLQKNDESDLRALFASCRKLHGPGKDAFVPTLSSKYKQPYSNLLNRPNALLLMGDQIYADDVSTILMENRLQALSNELMGREEDIPDKNPIRKSNYYAGLRQAGISNAADFTTTEGANHLARFGEFVAMYLLSWSGDNYLWPTEAFIEQKRKKAIVDSRAEHYLGGHVGWVPDNYTRKIANNLLKEIENLIDAKSGSLCLRKILANTPTYMIFDDHDVTDDWNITPSWQKKVEKNPLGRQIVANALAAYTLFQGWGNDPATIGDGTLLDNIEGRFAKPATTFPATYEEELLKFEKWSFLAPTFPPTLFVDSRTRRERSPSKYEVEIDIMQSINLYAPSSGIYLERDVSALPKTAKTSNSYGSDIEDSDYIVPQLIGPTIVNHLKDLLSEKRNEHLIIVTPGPVFDVPLIARFKEKTGSVAANDIEGWTSNKHSLMQFLQFLQSESNLTDVVLLSGDVHYAFSVIGSMMDVDFKLFNSSAVKNAPEPFLKSGTDFLGSLSDPNKQSFYFWVGEKDQINFSLCNILTNFVKEGKMPQLANKKYYKNLSRVETTFIHLLENGADAKFVQTNCNVGFLSSKNDDWISDLIVRTK